MCLRRNLLALGDREEDKNFVQVFKRVYYKPSFCVHKYWAPRYCGVRIIFDKIKFFTKKLLTRYYLGGIV